VTISNRQADFVWYWSNTNSSIADVSVQPIPAAFAIEGGAFTGASVPVMGGFDSGYQTAIPASLNGRVAIAGASARSNVSWAVGNTLRVAVSGQGFTVPTAVEQVKIINFLNCSIATAPFICDEQTIQYLVRVPGNGGSASLTTTGTTYWIAALPDNWSNDFLITTMSNTDYTTTMTIENPIPFSTIEIDRTGGADLVNNRINLTIGNVYLITAEVLVDGAEAFISGSVLSIRIASNLAPFNLAEKRFTGNDQADTSNPICYTMSTLLSTYGVSTPYVYLDITLGSGRLIKYHKLSVMDLGKRFI